LACGMIGTITDSVPRIYIAIENPLLGKRYPSHGLVQAIIDTAYEGFLAVPDSVFTELGLHELVARRFSLIMPTGAAIEAFAAYATIRVGNRAVDGLVETFYGLDEIVAGAELLSKLRVIIDYNKGAVTLAGNG